MLELTTRRKNIISGLIALVLLVGIVVVGVSQAFGAFDGGYTLRASFDAAGQGLIKNSDVKIRGVNIGKVEGVKLVNGRAQVTMTINDGQKVPTSTTAIVRAKTLFGEKFVDLTPAPNDAKTEATGPFYATDGKAMIPPDKTQGGFELEKVLSDAFPILKAIQPSELTTLLHELAVAGDGLGPTINRQLVNGKKVLDVFAAHDADTRKFLADLARLSTELGGRSDDLVAAAVDLNTALPTLNSRSDKLNSLLVQTSRLSGDVADLLQNNKAFIDKSFNGGQQVLDLLNAKRTEIIPLVIGLRQYAETLAESIRIPVGDGSEMAAVKSLNATQVCDLFGLFDCNGPVAATTAGPGLPPVVPSLGATGAIDPFKPIIGDAQQLLEFLKGIGQP
ncbi:MAG: phospholipid/cholesterol/gamma-HCH transport system substrate-binding protein [Acidimicrobiaceae bacterium]